MRNQLVAAIAIIALFLIQSCSPKKFESRSLYFIENNMALKNPTDGYGTSNLKFCSQLSFDGVKWNPSLSAQEQRSFAIALSISGYFEGPTGWSNITNNFDGMGLSAGLLNQTLGTQSLQPLLAAYEHFYPSEFQNAFDANHYQSIKLMLQEWKDSVNWRPDSNLSSIGLQSIPRPTEISQSVNSSSIDSKQLSQASVEIMGLSAPAAKSVNWAVNNLYNSSGGFYSSWKSQLQQMLKKSNYISFQVETARSYHMKAISYMNRIKIYDLRTYLLMFDIIVQNGGISESRFIEWENKVKSQGITSTAAKLKALVEVRLQDTKPQWVADVRARKYALIDGYGLVHGENFNFPQYYCFNQSDVVR